MKSRAVPAVLAALALAVGLAACGDDAVEEGSPPADDTLPPVESGYEHPTGADEIVFEYAEVGGFVPREIAFQQTPRLLVSGDGRAFTPGAQIAIYPGPLLPAIQVQSITEAGIQELLAAADEAGLLADVDYDQPTNIADASTARVTITVDGTTYVHEAYALGLGSPDETVESSPEREALAEFVSRLGDLPALVGADELGETELFEAEEYAIEAAAIDDLTAFAADGIEPTEVDWPAGAKVRLADATGCVVARAADVGDVLAEANQLTFFVEDGQTYQVFARPIVPGAGCA